MSFIPTLQDVLAARAHVYRYLKRTPLHYYASLSDLTGAQVWVKHENHQPTGAFKVRGGLVLAARLTPEQAAAGLFTASTGNHGQSIAFAAKVNGLKATIAVPEGANSSKVAAMRGLGAEVLFHGPDFDTAREWIGAKATQQGGVFIGPTHPDLICGVATYGLEIMEDLPDVEAIIVPVGGGSGACGVSIVAKAINPALEVIGVQSAQAPAAQRSWQAGGPVEAEMKTFAEGVATRVPFENTQAIMRQYLDDFVLVDDEATKHALVLLLEHTHNLPEGAAALPLAALLQLKERFAGKKVALVMSGGNLSLDKLRHILAETML